MVVEKIKIMFTLHIVLKRNGGRPEFVGVIRSSFSLLPRGKMR